MLDSRRRLVVCRLLPWLPSCSIFFNVFLVGNLSYQSYIRFAVLNAVAVVIYL